MRDQRTALEGHDVASWDPEPDSARFHRVGKVPVTARLMPFVARAADGTRVAARAERAVDRATSSSGAPLPAAFTI